MVTQSKHPFPAEITRVLHVRGSDFEIGVQHAEQVGEASSKGMLKFYYEFWKRILANAPASKVEKPIFRAVTLLIDSVLVNRLVAQIPPFAMERISGISKVTGRPMKEMLTSVVLPDLLPILEAYLYRLSPQIFVDVARPPRFGCSSFISSGKRFLHGRNLDFPGVSYWDRYPVIQVNHRKDSLKYVGFTSAGVPLCGITGVNEAQISVSLHQHYCQTTSLRGKLPYVIAEEILASAKSLKDAKEILSRSKVASSWAFILTDGKTREGWIYECHPKAFGIRALGAGEGGMAHSNFFQTEMCRPSEYAATMRMNWDNYWRKTRLETQIRAAAENLTPETAVQLLSEHFDPYWQEEKIVNRTVSQLYNIQSLVLDSEQMKVYFAEGDCPVQLRMYREYDLGEMLAGRNGTTSNTYSPYVFKDEKKKAAREAYTLSFVAGFDGRFADAQREMLRSLSFDYCPEAALVAGILHLKNGDYAKGKETLGAAAAFVDEKVKIKNLKGHPPEYFEILVFLARACDLLGQRQEALSNYQRIAAHQSLSDSHLKQIATSAKQYTPQRLSRIFTPFSSYIPFE